MKIKYLTFFTFLILGLTPCHAMFAPHMEWYQGKNVTIVAVDLSPNDKRAQHLIYQARVDIRRLGLATLKRYRENVDTRIKELLDFPPGTKEATEEQWSRRWVETSAPIRRLISHIDDTHFDNYNENDLWESLMDLGFFIRTFNTVGNALVQLRKAIPNSVSEAEIASIFAPLDKGVHDGVEIITALVDSCPKLPPEFTARLRALKSRAEAKSGISTTELVQSEIFNIQLLLAFPPGFYD